MHYSDSGHGQSAFIVTASLLSSLWLTRARCVAMPHSALLKGKLHFRSLEFNEVVVHQVSRLCTIDALKSPQSRSLPNTATQMLELPPHVRVASMTCTDLHVKISWTKLGSIPVRVEIGAIDIVIEETAKVRKPPRIIQIEPAAPGEYKRVRRGV